LKFVKRVFWFFWRVTITARKSACLLSLPLDCIYYTTSWLFCQEGISNFIWEFRGPPFSGGQFYPISVKLAYFQIPPILLFLGFPTFSSARSDYTCGIHDYGATQYAYQVGKSQSQFQRLPFYPLNLTGDFQVSWSGPSPWNNYIITNKMKNVKRAF